MRILLGTESTTRLAGMSGDQPLPVQREDLLDELLRFERIDVDEAAPGKRSESTTKTIFSFGNHITKFESE